MRCSSTSCSRLPGTAQFFASLGLPGILGYATFAAELVGGLLLVAGVKTRAVSIALVPVLIGATWAHAGNGWLFTAPKRRLGIPGVLDHRALVQALLGDGAYALRSLGAQPRRDQSGLRRNGLAPLSTHAPFGANGARGSNPATQTRPIQGEPHETLLLARRLLARAPHRAAGNRLALRRAIKVDLKAHKLADGTDYYTVNPKGYVPMLEARRRQSG